MKSTLTKVLLGAGVAAALGACASIPDANEARFERFEQVHQGLTQDEVRGIAGAPLYIGSNPRTNETQWTYEYKDEWGARSEFGVDFDKATGLVVETSNLRISDY